MLSVNIRDLIHQRVVENTFLEHDVLLPAIRLSQMSGLADE